MRLVLVLAGLVVACTSPDPRYYTLEAVPGQVMAGGPRTLELRRPGLAGYLDRNAVVASSADYRVTIASGNLWASSFSEMLTRVLAQDLTQRLPGTSVFTPAGALSATPDARIELDIQRFDVQPGAGYGTVVLSAQFAITRPGGHGALTEPFRVEDALGGTGTGAQVAAMSRALGQLADALARDLRR